MKEIIATRTNKVIYREDEKCYKVFNHDFSKSDILNEALNQARIEETDLNIPKIEAVTIVEGKWAIVSEYIEGKTLAELMEENPEKEEEYLNVLVDLQMLVHTKSSPLLSNLIDKMFRKISLADIDENTRYDLHTRLEGMERKKNVCHGDFNPSNVIVTPDGKYYIIDWSHVTQGNPAADAARTYLLFCLAGEHEKAYKYLELFCEKSNTSKQYVQKWMPIVACSQSVKGKAHEREFLLSWVHVVEFE